MTRIPYTPQGTRSIHTGIPGITPKDRKTITGYSTVFPLVTGTSIEGYRGRTDTIRVHAVIRYSGTMVSILYEGWILRTPGGLYTGEYPCTGSLVLMVL